MPQLAQAQGDRTQQRGKRRRKQGQPFPLVPVSVLAVLCCCAVLCSAACPFGFGSGALRSCSCPSWPPFQGGHTHAEHTTTDTMDTRGRATDKDGHSENAQRTTTHAYTEYMGEERLDWPPCWRNNRRARRIASDITHSWRQSARAPCVSPTPSVCLSGVCDPRCPRATHSTRQARGSGSH
jgi:hypothetical protein